MASTDKGTPSPMARLATLRAPRDLSLGGRGRTRGGAVKRKFLPVIPSATSMDPNSSLNMDELDSSPHPYKKSKRSEGQRRDWEERGHQNNCGRGRGRNSSNLIQTKSTLEATLKEWALNNKKERILPPGYSGVSSRGSKSEEQVLGPVPGFRGEEDVQELTEETMLRDEFFMLSIPKNEEAISTMNPLALPPQQKYTDTVPKAPMYSHLTEDKKGFHPGKIYFVTLPNKLPGQSQKISETPSASNKNSLPSSASLMPTMMEENAEKLGSLANFPEGLAGKLRFRRSGKVELVLGGNVLTCRGGASLSYQEAAMLDVRMSPPQFINFGQVTHWLDFSPDLISLVLNKYKNMDIGDQEAER